MRVIGVSSKSGYKNSNHKYMNFQRFSKQAGDIILLEGGFEQDKQWEQFGFSDQELQDILQHKIVRLEFEEPNKFFISDNPDTYDHYFYRVFTLCPYTAEWLNRRQRTKRRVPVFYPFNEEYIPKRCQKKYDIIYAGHIVSNKLMADLQTIAKFKYRFVSNSNHSLVTNQSATHEEKLKLCAETRITLVHNILYPKAYHLVNIWRTKRWSENEAFKMVPKPYQIWKWLGNKTIVVPQLKARLFEAAFSRSVILCKYDPFNVIERYFEPEREFVYFRDGELEDKIRQILANYPQFEQVAERAFRRAMKNYSTRAFFNTYLRHLD
jgi:hypothetical protein